MVAYKPEVLVSNGLLEGGIVTCQSHAGSYCTLDENFAIFLLKDLRKLSSGRLAVQQFLAVGTIGIHEEGG
jgi:hypothetical protein